jgi:hypothetical protein
LLSDGALGEAAATRPARPAHKTAKQVSSYPLMRGTAELDRTLTQVNCRITSIVRLRDAGAISERRPNRSSKKLSNFARSSCGRSMVKNLPLTHRTRLGPTVPKRGDSRDDKENVSDLGAPDLGRSSSPTAQPPSARVMRISASQDGIKQKIAALIGYRKIETGVRL